MEAILNNANNNANATMATYPVVPTAGRLR